MDPDVHKPTRAVAPEGRARRKVAALNTRQIVFESLFELKEVGDDSKFAREAQTAMAQEYHVYNKNK